MLNDQSMLGTTGADQMPEMAPQEPQMGGPPPPGQMPPPPEPVNPEEQVLLVVDFALSETNLAKRLVGKEDKDGNVILEKMASELIEGYEDDERSREPWMEK